MNNKILEILYKQGVEDCLITLKGIFVNIHTDCLSYTKFFINEEKLCRCFYKGKKKEKVFFKVYNKKKSFYLYPNGFNLEKDPYKIPNLEYFNHSFHNIKNSSKFLVKNLIKINRTIYLIISLFKKNFPKRLAYVFGKIYYENF